MSASPRDAAAPSPSHPATSDVFFTESDVRLRRSRAVRIQQASQLELVKELERAARQRKGSSPDRRRPERRNRRRGRCGTVRRPNQLASGRACYPRNGDEELGAARRSRRRLRSAGRLWFASPQGVGVTEGDNWTLMTGDEGLPYNEFTTMSAGENGVVWFGTTLGAIRYRRQELGIPHGPAAWLPDNLVSMHRRRGERHGLVRHREGHRQRSNVGPMTLAEKAKFLEDEIDKYHRRTPYGFVHSVR